MAVDAPTQPRESSLSSDTRNRRGITIHRQGFTIPDGVIVPAWIDANRFIHGAMAKIIYGLSAVRSKSMRSSTGNPSR